MTSMDSIKEFFSHKNIAVVGVSASGKGFGYSVYNKLKETGYNVYPVNNKAESIDGNKCYNSLNDLLGHVESLVMVIPPAGAVPVIKEAAAAGISNIWFQPGAESKEAVELAKQLNINVIDGECVMMHTEPVGGLHKFHRFLNKVTGKYPK